MAQITHVTRTIWRHQRSTSVRTFAATSASGTILSTPPSLTAWHAPDHTGVLAMLQGVGSDVTCFLTAPTPYRCPWATILHGCQRIHEAYQLQYYTTLYLELAGE